MIEKFSEDELCVIMSELGIKNSKPNYIVGKYRKELSEICKGMPLMYKSEYAGDKLETCIKTIIAIATKNITKNKKGNWIASTSVKAMDKKEYEEMYLEILEIIKKHNREWEADIKKSE